jgi:hypothetical protein
VNPKKSLGLATTSERCTVWVYGHEDDDDDEVGYLEEGEPVILLGAKEHWEEESSLSVGGHYMCHVLTRLGVGWINDSDLLFP